VRREFLIEETFRSDAMTTTYSHGGEFGGCGGRFDIDADAQQRLQRAVVACGANRRLTKNGVVHRHGKESCIATVRSRASPR
jgi:hypothetical protein